MGRAGKMAHKSSIMSDSAHSQSLVADSLANPYTHPSRAVRGRRWLEPEAGQVIDSAIAPCDAGEAGRPNNALCQGGGAWSFVRNELEICDRRKGTVARL